MFARTICFEFRFFYCMCAFFLPVFFLVRLAGGLDDVIARGLRLLCGNGAAGNFRRTATELLGMPQNLNGDLTKAAASHSRRLAHASRSMARSMLGQRNFMVVCCPCSPGHQFTVYGNVHKGKTWPAFCATCSQGCGAPKQEWLPVHVGSSGASQLTSFLEQVEELKAFSCNGRFKCITIGEWDDATAAKLVEQKVRVSLHTMTLHHALHTMAYTSSSLRAETKAAG
jgi:hypothetical protein